MSEVLQTLKTKQILYSENVIQIRQGIRQMYPDASPKDCATLFSTTVHKILERNLSEFEPSVKQTLKDTLLHQAIQKGKFDITAYDVLENYVHLDMPSERLLDDTLITWINHQQTTVLTKETMHGVMTNFIDVCLPPLVPPSSQPLQSMTTTINTNAIAYSNHELQGSSDSILHNNTSSFKKWYLPCTCIGLLAATVLITINFSKQTLFFSAPKQQADHAFEVAASKTTVEALSPNHLQPHLQYKEIDEKALNEWLIERDSILAKEPYFSSIISVAKEFSINPLLMFAITGQEQGFVKQSHPRAKEIANNPFNVFGSWQDFNTDIVDTSRIAARTILNLSKGCPKDEDPIKWLNQKYAEDPNWHLGVSQILNSLEAIAGLN